MPNNIPEHDSSIIWLVNVRCEGIVYCLWFKLKITFSVKPRLFLIKVYYATKLYTKVKEESINEYSKSSDIPNREIKCLIDKFEKMGSVNNTFGKGKKNVVMPEKWDEIMQLIEAMPTISSCHLASQAQVSHTSTYCGIWKTKFLCCIHIFQELKPADVGKKLHFCHFFHNFIHNHHSILSYIFFSDKAWFHLNSYPDAQNCRVWSSTYPPMYWEVSHHPL